MVSPLYEPLNVRFWPGRPLRLDVPTGFKKRSFHLLLLAPGVRLLGLLPAPGQAEIGIECRTDDTMSQSVLTTINNAITYDCVMAERAFTRALGGTCASPVACFCVLEDGDLRIRAQLFSEDGSEMIEDRAVFDCGDNRTPAKLARDLLGKAPESIRRLFGAQ